MSGAIPQQDGVLSTETFSSTLGELNPLMFVIQSMLSQINVATLVQVKAVHQATPTGPAGTVDVVPLVNQITGGGQAIPHTTIYGLPFFRLQGGGAALVCNPVVGDIGIALFCDRDVSSVKANATALGPTKARSNPPTQRRFSFSDGIYLGGWASNAAPSTSVVVDGSGITVYGGDCSLGSGVFKVNSTQVLQGQLTGLGTALPPTTLTGNYGADLASIQALYSKVVALESLLLQHGMVAP